MSHVGIFIYGSIVSVIVLGAYALLIWASIEDGREHRSFVQSVPERESADPVRTDVNAPASVPVGVE
jgi:hypothetical protein